MRKRREVQVFSLSFLDCICCGFGAIILIFILTLGRRPDRNESALSVIQEEISKVTEEITRETDLTERLRQAVEVENNSRADLDSKIEIRNKSRAELENDLALLLQQRSSLQEELDKLLGEKKAVPTQEERVPIPIPNVQRRQYLTGFNLEGNYILFIVEASGGMLGYTVDDAIAKIALTDDEKRRSEKWRRTIRSIQWIIANLTPSQNYQILLYNRDASPLLPERADTWFEPLNRNDTTAVLQALEAVTPQGGANLERAFATAKATFAATETIVLITDSLPNLSDSLAADGPSSDRDRERYFRLALREVPRRIPVNVLLFPMTGDPGAAFLLWQLASDSRGSLVSPAASWPSL